MKTPRSPDQAAMLGRAALVIAFMIWTFSLLRRPFGSLVNSFMHLVNLPFHEAGHILFSPFGDFMTVLGGSLLQVLVPAICAAAFLIKQEDPFGASMCLWWTGESLIDLAPYIDDARSLQLMLLGGPADEVEGHDWEAILTRLGWLHLDHTIASAVYRAGAIIMIGAMVWSVVILLQGRLSDRRLPDS